MDLSAQGSGSGPEQGHESHDAHDDTETKPMVSPLDSSYKPVPVSSPDSTEAVERFPSGGWCNDIVFAIAFVPLILSTIWLEAVDFDPVPRARVVLVVSALLAAAVGAATMALVVLTPKSTLWFAPFVSVLLVGFLSFLCFILDWTSAGVLTGLAALLMAVWLFRHRDKTDFAAVLLDTLVTPLLAENKMLVLVAAALLMLQTSWLAFLADAFVQSLAFRHGGSVWLYLGLALYWSTQVIRTLLHTTAVGTVCHSYFNVPVDAWSPNAVIRSLRLSLLSRFGTVCAGALAIPPARFLWALFRPWARSSERSRSRFACLCAKPYHFADGLRYRFNRFAFAQVLMYGKSLRQASEEVQRQFQQPDRDVDAIVDEMQLVDLLFAFPAIGGGAALASLCMMWARYWELDNWAIMGVVAFIIGFVTVSLTAELFEGAVTAVVSCFVEAPHLLAETHPILFHRFVRIVEFNAFQETNVFVI